MQLVFIFYIYLIHHAYTARFDVMGNLEKFWELNKALTQKQNASNAVSTQANL